MTIKEYNWCVDEFADRLYRFALKTLGDKEAANDVVQDSFERLWVKHGQVDFLKAKSYLFTTAYHAAIDFIRLNKRYIRLDEVNSNKQSVGIAFTDIQEILHAALSRLPEIQRSVILLRDYEGYSYQEIEAITGLSESQVKVYIYRGRLSLKEYIKAPQLII